MIYLLDTDTCVQLLRGVDSVLGRASAFSPDEIAISAVTHYELRVGALRCNPQRRESESEKVEQLLQMVHTVPFLGGTAKHAAEIRVELERRGEPIGPMDVLIAACARENGLKVVTGNLREFGRVPGLECESWV